MKKRVKLFLKKSFSILFICLITFSSIFPFSKVLAEQTYIGKVNGNDVRLRSKPTTAKENNVSNILMELDIGDVVTVLSMTRESGSGCSNGWYHVSYQNITGYICSSYISIDGYDVYDRPWTSPKKAIIGGAKFISGSYISRGQFTSYLKKYNVNPNGYYDVYNHLYMSNIAAPSSEAKTSYTAYSKNGLLNLPLSFNIPIYENMQEVYNRPGSNLVTVEKQTNVTDQNFENALNAQGFPEPYKQALRAVHTKHPNWTFTAMKTGLDFTEAAQTFKNIGAMQGGDKYYDLSSGSKVQAGNDSGWYIPNLATTEYYLDPRNFLVDQYILQFESLENSSNYTESTVQSILDNTFMSGLSILDNQSYASIFIEAGKVANVSSVYLASLARQESGTNGGFTTNGSQFEYNGVIYSGLYNFYNIGASSGASNPAKAGLVYASGGICTTCTLSSTGGSSLNLANSLVGNGYKFSGNYFTGFKEGESASTLKNQLQNYGINATISSDTIGTGTTIKYNNETYTVVVYGDLTGDGKINSADLLKMRQHLQGTISLSGAYKTAAAVANGSTINSADLLKIRQHLLGTSIISQG